MLSRVACVLYWFHPLVWTAARRLRAESERACDDLALLFGARPSEYAEHLLDIVTCVRDHNTPAVALAMAHRREFEGRMLAILDPELSRRGPSRARTALGMASLAGFALLVGAAAPVPRTTIASSARQAGSPVRPVPPESLVLPVPEVIAPAATRTATHTSTRTVTRTDTASELDGAAVASASGAASQAGVPGGDRMTALVRALRRDSSPEVRRTAAWGLKRYAENDTAAGALAAALQGDASAAVREMSAWALANARAGGTGAQAIMRALRAEKDPAVRSTAIWVAGEIGDGSSVATLATMLADSSADVREVAAWAIGQCNPDKAPPALVRALGDASRDVRLSVAWALYEIEDSGTVVALDAAFQKETDGEVQVGLLRALGSAGESAVPTLEKLVTSPNPEVRRIAVAALAGGQATGPWPWPRPRPRPYP
jgi:HEAT repeat protein